MIKQIQEDGTYEVTGVDQADAIVVGTIQSVERTKARSLQGNVLASSEFNLRITMISGLSDRIRRSSWLRRLLKGTPASSSETMSRPRSAKRFRSGSRTLPSNS